LSDPRPWQSAPFIVFFFVPNYPQHSLTEP